MTRVRDTPHVGRHRLFDRAVQKYRCRVCLVTYRDGNLERHRDREISKLGEEEVLRRIELFLIRRGRSRLKRRTQYYHEKAKAMEGLELDPRYAPRPVDALPRRTSPVAPSSTPNPGTRRSFK